MKVSTTLIGSIFAFLLATSCCWLPFVAVILGGAAGLTAFSQKLDAYSGVFMAIGVIFFGYAGYTFWQKQKNRPPTITLESVLTCPNCGHQKNETMPTNACQYFYECEQCKKILKPLQGYCCVYCSYGSVKCPPIQAGEGCC